MAGLIELSDTYTMAREGQAKAKGNDNKVRTPTRAAKKNNNSFKVPASKLF